MKNPFRSLPDAYPLQWPTGWPRTAPRNRHDSRYDKRISEGRVRDELLDSIRKLGGVMPIISSNVELRLDGLPYANRRYPEDGGIAVYWVRDGKQEVMACDKWNRPWENMRAIYHAIEGLRAMERAGASQIFERAFQAFQLPEGPPKPGWREVLGNEIKTRDEALKAFREKAKKVHPDVGGSTEEFQRVESAFRAALEELQQ